MTGQSNKTIRFINRYSGRTEEEAVYGERWLRFAYNNPLGQIATFVLVSRSLVSRLYGRKMDRRSSRRLIDSFIESYGIDRNEMVSSADEFESFNAFFYRKLKASARPIAHDPDAVVFPADGRHMAWQRAVDAEGIFVKGQRWNLHRLLGSRELGDFYANGTLLISRLCPVDYHRFHFPVSGTLGETKLIDGPLYSVNPYALRKRIDYLWTNKRAVTPLNSDRCGMVYVIEVGATMVGGIHQTRSMGDVVLKGDEKGYFSFGGSTVITLFPPDTVRISEDLENATMNRLELYAHMGDTMGTLLSTNP